MKNLYTKSENLVRFGGLFVSIAIVATYMGIFADMASKMVV